MMSIVGITVILLLCLLLSKDRRLISWQTILIGLTLQAGLAFLVLKTDLGKNLFSALSATILNLLSVADQGGHFAFGNLYDQFGFVFAFKLSGAIIFICALTAFLYRIGVLHRVLVLGAWVLQKLLRVSGAEALANVSSALVGQVESALPLKPYFPKLSNSQFFAIMTGGMSTISAALMATYTGLGIPANYLLAANLMGIPAGLVIAKMLYPSDPEESLQTLPEPEQPDSANLIDATVHGAQEGLKISLGVISLVIAFVSLVALIDQGLGYFKLSLAQIFGYIFYPLAWIIGAPSEEAGLIGGLIGKKIAINEFVAYLDLKNLIERNALSARGVMLSCFAICGFANFGSVAIQLGAFTQILPERRRDFAEMGLMALVAGALASCLSACWANLFFD
ncbi:MAG: nucleoside transporter C-terminal domain-containing protein [Candidatus Caenarcaniphilales bacterium]|nr:nucleoside transporter C-terminal domain-containing protein [Candidatus Caenarcaniphilales bacterium]